MTTSRQLLQCSLILISLIVMLPTIVLAHGDQQHVMGTVTKVEAGSISVKTTTGEVKEVMILPTTKFLKGTAAVTQQDVKVGDRRGHSRQAGGKRPERNRSQDRRSQGFDTPRLRLDT
jgi:hypothetical protein